MPPSNRHGVTDLAPAWAPPPASRLLGLVLASCITSDLRRRRLRPCGAWQQRNAFADLPVRILGEAEPRHLCRRG
jgi:hypothetical protein